MNRLILYLSALILLFGADSLVARNRPLNIGSYNIRCNNPGDGENAWPNRKERVKALILFHEYDVVGVQEARPEQMEDLQQMPGFASVGVGRDGEAGGEFSAIFYRVDRIQVLDSGTFWLSETPEKVSLGRRFEPDLYVGQDEGPRHASGVLLFQHAFRPYRSRGAA